MIRSLVFGLTLAAAGFTAQADTLILDGLDMAAATTTERPSRGQTMATVETRVGSPSSKASAVGAPPIARWEYPGFTVFFEYDHVIHAVARR